MKRLHICSIATVLGLLLTVGISTIGAAQEGRTAELAKTCQSKSGTWSERYRECEYVDRQWCATAGGRFEECASACRHNPDPATGCTMQCIPLCIFSDEGKKPDTGNSAPLNPTETKSETDKTKKAKKKPRGTIVAAPLPIVSPAIGSGLIPVVGYIFPFSKNDHVSPPSTIGAGGMFTNDGSRGYAVGAQLFMKENTYAISATYAHGNINYNLYGVGFMAGNQPLKLPLEQSGKVFFSEVLRKVGWKFFVGPRFWDGSSFITLRPINGKIPPLPPDLGIYTNLRALGVRVVRDTRPNHFYPTAGMKVELTSDFFAKALGSKYSYQSYKTYFDKYWSLGKDQVLVYDLFLCNTTGSPPFYGNCIYGTQNELRGYEAGRYLDRHMVATQVEYRLSLPKKIGLAGFGGVGEVFPGASQLFRVNHVLPSVGGGPRYELSSKYHLNLRADFARGKDSWTWSMGVGEAF